jgi:hypothetical protein
MDDQQFEGAWAIVTSAGKSVIGRVLVPDDKYRPAREDVDQLKALMQAGKLDWVEVDSTLDWAVALQINQNGATKIPAMTPHDMLNTVCRTHVRPTQITFFEDMQEEDRKRYKEMVGTIMTQMKRERSAKNSGLHLVKDLPTDLKR